MNDPCALLAEHLPQRSQTVAAIFAYHKRAGDAQQARGYLGASIIGHPCERYLWYCFRQCCRPEYSGRMYRLFETGNLEEARFIRELREIGCEVHEIDQNTGKQFEVSAFGGHLSGHMDGRALGVPEAPKTWHVLEFKTHNAKSFAKLVKDGVKQAKPRHYAQMMVYMHLSGMTRALYLAVNKDTDDLYSERVRYDRDGAWNYMYIAEKIILAFSPPERIASRPDYWECKYCDARDVCWGKEACALPVPSINCRQCCHATPTMDGGARWICERHKRGLDPTSQARACEDHLALPELINFAHPVSSGPDFIVYEFDNESRYQFRCGPGGYATSELMALPAKAINGPTIQAAKELFGAVVKSSCPNDILSRYPESDSRVVWKGRLSGMADAWLTMYREHMTNLSPIMQCVDIVYKAAEFEHGRVAISWSDGTAEIREGVE